MLIKRGRSKQIEVSKWHQMRINGSNISDQANPLSLGISNRRCEEKCHFNKSLVHANVTGGVKLPKNETKLAQWLLKNGPISIGINANAMQWYWGGVSHPWSFLCSPGTTKFNRTL